MKIIRKKHPHYRLTNLKSIDLLNNSRHYKLINRRFLLRKKQVGNTYKYVPVFKTQLLAYSYLAYRVKLKVIKYKNTDFKITVNDIIYNIFESFEVIKQQLPSGNFEYLIYNFDEHYYVPLRTILNNFIVRVTLDKILNISNIESAFRSCLACLASIESLDDIHYNTFKRPPVYWLNVKNGVFDLKTKTFVDNEIANNYHFTSKINFNIIEPKEVNKLYSTTIDRMFDNWTDNNEEKKLLLQQIAFAMIDGNGRKKSVIFQSPGGGGKSTFIKINSLIVGNNNVINCGMYELNNDNLVGQLSPSIKFMQGDDANTNARMNDIALSRMKSLNDGGEFMVDVKFEPSKNVYFHGLIIQNTNSDIGFYENNPALADRILLFEWTSKNFRSGDSKLEIELSDMLGNVSMGIAPNQEFLEAYLSYIIYDTKWFINYTIPDSVKESTKSLLASNDNVAAYVDFLVEQGITELPYININLEYKRYELWLADNNSGAKPLKSKKFTKELTDKLMDLGYIMCSEDNATRFRATQLKLIDYNYVVHNQLTDYEVDLNKKLKYNFLFNPNNTISDDDIKTFDYEVTNDTLDLSNPKMLTILHYKIYELQDPTVTNLYGDNL